MMLKKFIKSLSVGTLVALSISSQSFASAWDDYKAKYLQQDGAIVDTGNNNMSHSEGQGYGLMFALAYDDKESFEKILNWTNQNLKDPKSGLFYWSYRRDGSDPIPDKNNATDGDLFIAWTLIKAGKKWQNKAYLKQGETLANLVTTLTATKVGGYNVILPGVSGFFYDNYVVVNPSYFIYPAFKDLANYTYIKLWKELSSDGKKLLNNLSGQKIKLAPDWLELHADSTNLPAPQWPSRSSYDAIRVPLYLYWADPNCPELQVYKTYYASFDANNTPAWVDVVTEEKANYFMSSGLRAVRDLVMGKVILEPEITKSEDYYNASLSMLAYLAYLDNH